MIPENEWRWYGTPLHFIAAAHCEYHLGTLVGDYIVSTVARYRDDRKGIYRQVGCGRWGETYVFKFGCINEKCGCPEFEGNEIDATFYQETATCRDMDAGHLAMCRKYAEIQEAPCSQSS